MHSEHRHLWCANAGVNYRVYNPRGDAHSSSGIYTKKYTPAWLFPTAPMGATEWGTALCNCVFCGPQIPLFSS